ncbi:MAG: UbiD family decarboxylase, partial [Deltaproteobacteria bacterium]|nr:UbiD family decarboxylase [Deltaproteobacteria bacterium]
MPYPDLNAFLADLERSGDLVRVTRPVSPHLELAAIVYELCNRQGPAVLFERVEGAALPVLCNLYGTRDRVARALGAHQHDLLRHYLQALEHPLPTKLVSDAPCQEVVRSGGDLDLTALLPQIFWHPEDGGP